MAHHLVRVDCGHVVACLFELLRDSHGTCRVNRQYCSWPDSIAITGLFFHVINVTQLLKNGFRGEHRLTDENLRELKLFARSLAEEVPEVSEPAPRSILRAHGST